jgi:hypothetical protein
VGKYLQVLSKRTPLLPDFNIVWITTELRIDMNLDIKEENLTLWGQNFEVTVHV